MKLHTASMRCLAAMSLVFAATMASAQSLGDLKKALNAAREKTNQVKSAARQATAAAPGSPAQRSDGKITLWVERMSNGSENPLHSEVAINGTTVDIFTSDKIEPIEQYLKEGWNTVAVTTTPQEPSNSENSLIFRIGPAFRQPKDQQLVMKPVLWEFRNGTDWTMRDDGTWRHARGPKVKQVELSFQFYFAGLNGELRELDEGDLVLMADPRSNGRNPSVSGTIFINGTPLNTFFQPQRQVVITPYLKKGKNEIKIVSARVRNGVQENDLEFVIAGPARWNASEEKFELKPLLQFRGMQGWVRDAMSGQLLNRTDPESDTVERVIPLLLKDSDQAGE